MGIRGKLGAAGLIVALVPVAAAVGSVTAGAGVAGSVVVTTTADELTVDGDCSLREAFETVNTGAAFDACQAGSSTIELSIGTYTFDSGELGPLVAETSMHLLGVDATSSTIVETGLGTAVRAEAGVTLFVQDLAISGGTAVHMETGAGLLLFHDARVSGGDYAFLTDDSDVEAERTTFAGGYFAVGQTTSGDITVSSSTVQGDDESLGLRSTAGSISAETSTLDTPLRAPSVAIDRSYVGPCLECTPLSIGAGSLSLVNSTVEVPLDHPAIQVTTGSATIVSSTLHAGPARPAIAVTGTGTATVTGSIATCAGAAGVVSGGGNVSDGSCGFAGTGDVVGDPKLLAPAANGGFTKTQSLAPGSAAIDRAPTCPTVDQRNAPRPKDADGDGTPECDSGALELDGPPSPPPPPPPPPLTVKPVVGDWNGDGIDSPGYVSGNFWHLRDTLSTGGVERQALLANTSAGTPIVGDWDGDGDDGIGVVVQEATRLRWYLQPDPASGFEATIVFTYAGSGSPVVGDWDGNGTDDIGVVQGGTWFLRTAFAGGPADLIGRFGGAGDVRIAGDWDGDGDATPGVVRGRTRFLKNDLTGGTADLTFTYGLTTDVPLVGDWDGDGVDTPGVARSTTAGIRWSLRNTNTPGTADVVLRFGP
jgi:CSLREA domain-containing protein